MGLNKISFGTALGTRTDYDHYLLPDGMILAPEEVSKAVILG